MRQVTVMVKGAPVDEIEPEQIDIRQNGPDQKPDHGAARNAWPKRASGQVAAGEVTDKRTRNAQGPKTRPRSEP